MSIAYTCALLNGVPADISTHQAFVLLVLAARSGSGDESRVHSLGVEAVARITRLSPAEVRAVVLELEELELLELPERDRFRWLFTEDGERIPRGTEG